MLAGNRPPDTVVFGERFLLRRHRRGGLEVQGSQRDVVLGGVNLVPQMLSGTCHITCTMFDYTPGRRQPCGTPEKERSAHGGHGISVLTPNPSKHVW